MINKMKDIEIQEKVNLHLLKSDKFKTDLIGIYIKRPLKEKEASMNALLTRVLERGMNKYRTAQKLNIHLDGLYGAILVSDVHKYGEKHVFQFKMQIPDKRYVPSDDIFLESIDTLNEMINHPLIIKDGFKEEYVEQEKKNLIQTIRSLKNDKSSYAIRRCIEVMCEGEPFKISQNGSIEKIESIDAKELYKYYREILKTSPIDICVIGNIDFDYVEAVIRKKLKFERENIISLERENIYKLIDEVKDIEEEMEVEQGKLTLGFRTNTSYDSLDYEASVLFTTILGGGANSKLFNEIREEKSLSYYIYAKLEKHKSILLITAGINTKDKNQVVDLIKSNVRKIQEGVITEEELEIAKKSIISSLESKSDYPNSFINYYYNQLLGNQVIDIEKLIKKYQEVTIEEIVSVSKKTKLDTIHFIKGKEKVTTNEN